MYEKKAESMRAAYRIAVDCIHMQKRKIKRLVAALIISGIINIVLLGAVICRIPSTAKEQTIQTACTTEKVIYVPPSRQSTAIRRRFIA